MMTMRMISVDDDDNDDDDVDDVADDGEMMMMLTKSKTMLELTLCRRPGWSGHLSRRRRWSPGLSLPLQPRHLHPGRDRGLGDRLWGPAPWGLRCGEPGGLLGGPRHLLPLRRGRPGGVPLQVQPGGVR